MTRVPWPIAIGGGITAFCVYVAIAGFVLPEGRLSGDETIYYFQAQHLRIGELVWFEHTQPFLHSFVLAASQLNDVGALRVLASAIMAASVLVAGLAAARSGGTWGFLVCFILLAFHSRTLHLGPSLFTEPLFSLLTASFVLCYLGWREDPAPSWRRSLLLGVLLGLGLEARTVAIIFAAPLVFDAALPGGRSHRRPLVIVLLTAVGLALPYYLPFGLGFLDEKLAIGGYRLVAPAEIVLRRIPGYLGIPILVLLLGSGVLLWRRRRETLPRFLLVLIPTFLGVTIVFDHTFFSRHLYPLVMAFSLAIPAAFAGSSRRLKGLVAGLAVLVCLGELRAAHDLLPIVDQNNYHFVSGRPGARNVPTLEVTSGPRAGTTVTLPDFAQPTRSTAGYRAEIRTRRPYSMLVLNYVDDEARVTIDGVPVVPEFVPSVYEPLIVPVSLPPGAHVIEIEVRNPWNQGGIGQVLLATDAFVRDVVRRYPYREL